MRTTRPVDEKGHEVVAVDQVDDAKLEEAKTQAMFGRGYH